MDKLLDLNSVLYLSFYLIQFEPYVLSTIKDISKYDYPQKPFFGFDVYYTVNNTI